MKDNKKVLYNFFIIGLSSITNLLLPILLIPHFINKLGIELYGTIALAQSLMSYMNVIVEYHFSTITVKEIAIHRSNQNVLNMIVCRTIYVRFILLLTCLLLVLIITIAYPPFALHYNIIFLSCMIVVGQVILPNWFLIALEEVLALAILNIVFKAIYIFLALNLINSSSDAILPNFFLGLTNTIAGIIGLIYIFQKYKLEVRFPQITELIHELKTGYLMTISNIATSIYNSGSPLILALFYSPRIVGEYTAAERILGLFRNVLAVYFQATYPRAAKIMLEGKTALKKFYRETFSFLLAGVVTFTLLFFFCNQSNHELDF
jgi:PST family polysaccharide transporter